MNPAGIGCSVMGGLDRELWRIKTGEGSIWSSFLAVGVWMYWFNFWGGCGLGSFRSNLYTFTAISPCAFSLETGAHSGAQKHGLGRY